VRVLYLILLIASAICFALATVLPTPMPTHSATRTISINLIAVGLALWVLVPLIQTADHLGD
jgi:hypothetical protein